MAEISEKEKRKDVVYGSDAGNTCPSCEKGVMVKIGGCTQCSQNCGFTGSCDTR